MLGDCQCLGQNICHHIIHSYELEVNSAIGDALPNKMVPDIDMLCCSMIDRVMGEEVGGTIVNVQSGQPRHTLTELAKKFEQPDQLLSGLGCCDIFRMCQ